jgi:anti-sigma B factor antagonist
VTKVQVVMDKAIVVVVLRGEIDVVSADEVGLELLAAMRATPARRCVVIDMRDVSFLDSCGLQMLLQTRNHATEEQLELFLVMGDDTIVRRMFAITGLDKLFAIHRRVGDGLDAARRCVEVSTAT